MRQLNARVRSDVDGDICIFIAIWFMGRREVLVQSDDDLVARLDRLAAAHGMNRSELLRRGAAAVLDAEELRQADVEVQAPNRFTPKTRFCSRPPLDWPSRQFPIGSRR